MSTAPRGALVAAYVACALIWGTTWFAIRVCIGDGGYPTYEALALRFALASAVLVPWALWLRRWPRAARTWIVLIVAGVLDAVGYALVYLGEERISGGVAAVLYGTQPLVYALILWLSRLDRVRRSDVAGAVVSLLGVGVLFADRLDVSWAQAVGVLLVLGSVVASALYASMMKRWAEGEHPVVVTTIFLGVTALVLGAVALGRGAAPVVWPPALAPTLALVYLALVGSVIAFATFFWLLARVSVMTTGTLVFVFPLVALAVDAVWERDVALGGRGYLGVAITLAGLVVSLRGRGGGG
ncbi:MAG: DMT family transporter [Kofleriaceae bacterium]|nr:DMT family transporter [Kofleriaceae bacterium]